MTQEQMQPTTETAGTVTLWTLLWAHRTLLLLGGALGLILGAVFAFTRPTTYTAATTILYTSAGGSSVMGLMGGSSGSGSDLPSLPLLNGALLVPQPVTGAKTAKLLLQSWPIQDAVIRQHQLVAAWKLRSPARAREAFQEHLILREGESGEFHIGFKDDNAKRALAVTQSLLDELEQKTRELGLNTADRNLNFLTDQCAQAERDLAQAQQRQLKYEEAHEIIALPDQIAALAKQYETLQDDLTTTQTEATLATQRASLLSNNAQRLIHACIDPNAATGNTGLLGSYYQRVSQLESDIALLRERYAPTSPEITEASQQLQEAKRQLSQEVQRQLDLVNTGNAPVVSTAIMEAVLKQAAATRLQQAAAKAEAQAAALPKTKTEYARLVLDVEAQTARVKLYRGELEKARILAQDRGPAFYTIEPARLPVQPDERHRMRFLALGLLAGLLLAGIKPYLRWQQANSAATEAELADDTATEPTPIS